MNKHKPCGYDLTYDRIEDVVREDEQRPQRFSFTLQDVTFEDRQREEKHLSAGFVGHLWQ